jgi:hypothetical protein
MKDWLLAFGAAACLVWLAVWAAYIFVWAFYG